MIISPYSVSRDTETNRSGFTNVVTHGSVGTHIMYEKKTSLKFHKNCMLSVNHHFFFKKANTILNCTRPKKNYEKKLSLKIPKKLCQQDYREVFMTTNSQAAI